MNDNKLQSLLYNFVLGGILTLSISYISTYLDPLLAAIWWSFPLSLIPSMWYMKQHGKDNKYIAKFSLSTTYALSLLVISTISLFYFFKETDNSFWMPIAKASGIWLFFSIVFFYSVKYFKLEKKFI